MAPKKATGAAAATKAKKSASGASHPTFKEMIKEAIITLKERNGSSRQSIKKYIISNKGVTDDKQFASQLNRALRSGVEKGEFAQPKGPSGPVKLAHKETAKKASPPKESAKKEAKPKTETKKKAATATKKTAAKPAAKKAATKKTTAAKPKAKANTSSKRKTAPSAAAPAVVDKPTTLTKTKSGRVAKTTAAPATKKAPAKKAAPKKAAPKKAEAKAEA